MQVRHGEAFELDEQSTVLGGRLQAGDLAPDFTLDHFDGTNMSTIHLKDTAGKVRLLNVINSLDTPVCHVETHRWENLRADLPTGTVVYTISMDLPYAQSRWQASEGVSHAALSAHKSEQFGLDYGVLIKEWRLLQRAVFVIDGDGRITYADYVPDQGREPDYNRAVAAARDAASAH
jgi:thiol peroxidase